MDIPLTSLRGIGPMRVKALNDAGIFTVRDIVMYLPVDYRDMLDIKPLSDAQSGEVIACRVRVVGSVNEHRANKLLITKVYVTDGTETLQVVWYNQPWLKSKLVKGAELLLYGKVDSSRGLTQIVSPTIESESKIIPVYRNIAGLPQKIFRQLIEVSLKECEGQWPDELPESVRRKYGLCERNFAMRNAHFPDSREALSEARRRVAFEELLLFQVALNLIKTGASEGIAIGIPEGAEDKYWSLLKFPPTGAQRRVLGEVISDMRASHSMARLIQGDVGCGKTAIAFGGMYLAAKSGYQSALMAPTEVLAQQHYESAKELFEPLGIGVGILTGSLTQKEHRVARENIASGDWQIIIGTHALITESVEYKNLALVITDEQHRFGVRQRAALGQKGKSPNVLVMSATPIPRTLALILYGDLDISIVDEMPKGRTPVKTRIVPDDKRAGMYKFLRDEVKKGRQVYVVCPLVEDSEAVDAISAEQVYSDLSTQFLKDLRVALAHGKQKSKDKDATLETFRRGEIDVLVSTTVIEVGVNVPNATVMVIENAERFGLAQLHQLRGRVGRGSYESWCFLMAEPNERLRLLTRTNDGFIIAQKDMELRGPGELFGQRQTGLAGAGIDMMAGDTQMLQVTHDEAREIVKRTDNDAKTVIALAKEMYDTKMSAIAMN